jgi:hypothetical protein
LEFLFHGPADVNRVNAAELLGAGVAKASPQSGERNRSIALNLDKTSRFV